MSIPAEAAITRLVSIPGGEPEPVHLVSIPSGEPEPVPLSLVSIPGGEPEPVQIVSIPGERKKEDIVNEIVKPKLSYQSQVTKAKLPKPVQITG